MPRQIGQCETCGELRQIVSNGLCARCNMRLRRAIQDETEPEWLKDTPREDKRMLREREKELRYRIND